MTFLNASASVTATSALVYSAGVGSTALIIRNTGEQTAFVGPPGVTDSTGLSIEEGELLLLSGLGSGDVLHGVCAAGQSTTLVMLSRNP